MILINFTHPLTADQIEQAQKLTGQPIQRLIELPTQFDHQLPFAPQLKNMMADLPLSAHDLQTQPVLVNLPALTPIAALLLAELHGRMGYFPPVLRIRPVEGSLPPRFEVAEILNLQEFRDRSREMRKS